MKMSRAEIGKEFAHKAKPSYEDSMKINLWGLFQWIEVSPYIKTGEIIPDEGYSKENRVIWCKPSQSFYKKWILPLVNKTNMKLKDVFGKPEYFGKTFYFVNDLNKNYFYKHMLIKDGILSMDTWSVLNPRWVTMISSQDLDITWEKSKNKS